MIGFKVVGTGVYTKEALLELLTNLGIQNPLSVIKEAERGRTVCGEYRILAIR